VLIKVWDANPALPGRDAGRPWRRIEKVAAPAALAQLPVAS
jgi:hypothetical protein